MALNAGITNFKPTTMTVESKNTKKCRKCFTDMNGIGRVCTKCQITRQQELLKVSLQRKKLCIKKQKEKKLLTCLRCKLRPRYKRKKTILTVCRTCYFETNVPYWGEKAWETFSKWMKRNKDYFTCYTCEKIFPIDEAQTGHCFHRGNQMYKLLDFDPQHLRLQCGGCNCFSMTQTNIFQAKLTRELGIEEVEKMIWRRHNEPVLTIEELKEIIKLYE